MDAEAQQQLFQDMHNQLLQHMQQQNLNQLQLQQKMQLQADINQVTIKAPAFSESALPGWFTILESQFNLKNITAQSTKFFNVVSALPADLVAKLPQDLITQQNYDELKKTVIEIYEKTKPELFNKLISSSCTKPVTGRPSIYLQELQTLATKVGVGDDLIRHKFIQSLPQHISPVLAAQKDLTLRQIGNLADELMPLYKQQELSPPVQAIQQPKNSATNHPANTNHAIPYGLRPFNSDQKPKVCKAHIYFSHKAKTCKPWCEWPNKSNCRIQPNSRPSSPARSQPTQSIDNPSEN